MLISVRTCQGNGLGHIEMKTVFRWNHSRSLRTCLHVISFCADTWRDWFMDPPLPASIDELKQRITSVLDNGTGDMQQRVWQELNYNLICTVSQTVHMLNTYENKLLKFNEKISLSLKFSRSYLPTPPLGQDMTQGQFLSGVWQVWIQSFSFS